MGSPATDTGDGAGCMVVAVGVTVVAFVVPPLVLMLAGLLDAADCRDRCADHGWTELDVVDECLCVDRRGVVRVPSPLPGAHR